MSDISVINIYYFFKYFEILPGTLKILPRHCDVGRRGTCDVHTRVLVLAPLARHVVSINYQ